MNGLTKNQTFLIDRLATHRTLATVHFSDVNNSGGTVFLGGQHSALVAGGFWERSRTWTKITGR